MILKHESFHDIYRIHMKFDLEYYYSITVHILQINSINRGKQLIIPTFRTSIIVIFYKKLITFVNHYHFVSSINSDYKFTFNLIK